MARALLALLVAAGLIVVAWFAASLPGHIEGQVGRYDVSASTPVAALGLLVLFVVLYALFRTISALFNAPRHLKRRRHGSRRERGDYAVTGALLALAAGDEGDARREAARARKLLGDTPQTLLLTAEAGRLAGREQEATAAFRLLAQDKRAAFLGLRGLMRQAMARQDWDEAAKLAREAEASHPGAGWLKSERQELAIRTGAWSEALALAKPEAERGVLATAAAEAEADPAKALELSKQAFTARPDLMPASLAYARRLRAGGREQRALETIRATWARAPHPELGAFALAAEPDKLARVQIAQRIAQENPRHPESRLLVARAALDAGVIHEARQQAEAARAAGLNERRLHLLTADIEEAHRGETDEGRIAQRDALRAAAVADPDPSWRCEVCGTTHEAWHPVCGTCGTLGRIVWASGPARPATPALTAEPAGERAPA